MSGISDHFFEDSPTSRGAIGNVLYMCILLSNSFVFLKNETTTAAPKIKRNTAISSEATDHLQKLLEDLPNTKPEQCFEKFQPALVEVCNSTGLHEVSDCDRFVNNGMWDICQSLKDHEQCGVIAFEYTTADYFFHPAFLASSGFLVGCILALIALLIISCVCSRCKNKKEMKNGQKVTGSGSGSATVEAGKAASKAKTFSDTKNSSDEKNGNIGKTVKPTIPKSQYIGEQLGGDAAGKQSVFIGAKTVQKPLKSVRNKPAGDNKKKKNKYGKDVGALTAMEVTMYK